MQKLPQNYAIMIQNATNIRTICLSQALKLAEEYIQTASIRIAEYPHRATSEQKKNRQQKAQKKVNEISNL